MKNQLFNAIVARTLRVPCDVPASVGVTDTAFANARALDVALMGAGFKLGMELLVAVASGGVDPVAIRDAVLPIVGAHVNHNTYFLSFPRGVPGTMEAWFRSLVGTGYTDGDYDFRSFLAYTGGAVYGRYQHTYEEMVAAVERPLDRSKVTKSFKVLTKGGTLAEEAQALFTLLLSSAVPLNEADRKTLVDITAAYKSLVVPDVVPVRENLALANAYRVTRGIAPVVSTVTDVLRLCVAMNGGDVTLEKGTRFRSPSRAVRRSVVFALEALLTKTPRLEEDVLRYAEMWKRLGERLHAGEFADKAPLTANMFKAVRGERDLSTLPSRVEAAFRGGKVTEAIRELGTAPGMLARNVDRLLTAGAQDNAVVTALADAAPRVSGRVLLSLREHLANRTHTGAFRAFANKGAKAWVTTDKRGLLSDRTVDLLCGVVDREIARRVPKFKNLSLDPLARGVALPLSEKTKSTGYGVLPRGSDIPVTSPVIRFFCYWHQTAQRTDYDLSVLLLDTNLNLVAQCSWTSLRAEGGQMVHSGDVTEAAKGASEFLDVDFRRIPANVAYIVPQVNVFSGESFKEVKEAFVGFMARDGLKSGEPYEPSTVVAKSDLRGEGGVALPVAFRRVGDGWVARWLDLYQKGVSWGNRLERNKLTTGLLVRGILERRYLTVGYLCDLVGTVSEEGADTTHIGLAPRDLVTTNITPSTLATIIPQ